MSPAAVGVDVPVVGVLFMPTSLRPAASLIQAPTVPSWELRRPRTLEVWGSMRPQGIGCDAELEDHLHALSSQNEDNRPHPTVHNGRLPSESVLMTTGEALQ